MYTLPGFVAVCSEQTNHKTGNIDLANSHTWNQYNYIKVRIDDGQIITN